MPFRARWKSWHPNTRDRSRCTTGSRSGRASPLISRRRGGSRSTSTASSGTTPSSTALTPRDDDPPGVAREDVSGKAFLPERFVYARRHDREGFAMVTPAPEEFLDRSDVLLRLGGDTRRQLVLVADQGHRASEVKGDAL